MSQSDQVRRDLVTDVRTFNGALFDLLADADFTLGQLRAMAGTEEHC